MKEKLWLEKEMKFESIYLHKKDTHYDHLSFEQSY